MKICVDTNILLRVLVGDDPVQAALAEEALRKAETIIVPVPVFCELVWVLGRSYKFSRKQITSTIEKIVAADKVQTDRRAVECGLKVLSGGGDFADGAICDEGAGKGANAFVTFDQDAADLLSAQGYRVVVPG